MEVIELCKDDTVNIKQIAKTISNDPALSSKIIKTVNSSYYGLTQPVSTISHALVILGLNSVRTLALGFTLVGSFKDTGGDDFDMTNVWRRCLYSAVGARLIAMRVGSLEYEEAFLGGLLQDLGLIAMVQALGKDYIEILTSVGDEHALLRKNELQDLELDHTQVGERLAAEWKLPEVLSVSIVHHEAPSRAPHHLADMVQAVALGARAADVFITENSKKSVDRYFNAANNWFQIRENEATELLEKIQGGTREIAKLFEIPPPPGHDVGQILVEANEVLQDLSLRSQQDTQKLMQENQSLQKKADTDALTGLANRGRFNEFFRIQFQHAERQHQPLSFILFDIDRFKSVNDTHGHMAGDKVLVAIASIVQQNSPDHALVARYGGEEFGVVIPGMSRPEAAILAESLRNAIEQNPIECSDELTLDITASMGVASFDGVSVFKRPEQLIKAADQAVYAAKDAGRNCVRVFAPRVSKPETADSTG
jgi:diguanylate cyclase (GGDEF)-like protein